MLIDANRCRYNSAIYSRRRSEVLLCIMLSLRLAIVVVVCVPSLIAGSEV
jgi:hypothetical protein